MKKDRIDLPLVFFNDWIDHWNHAKIKYYLTLLIDAHENGHKGWRLEVLCQLLKHQSIVMEEKLSYWEEEGWISKTLSPAGATYYYLTPIQETDVLNVSKSLLLKIKQQAKNVDLTRWLWLQRQEVCVVSQRDLMKSFGLEHQNGLYRTLRELRSLDVLEYYRISIDEAPHCEFKYEPGIIEHRKQVIPVFCPEFESTKGNVFKIPMILIDWMMQVDNFMAIKLYCQWLWRLREIPNYPLTLNELVSDVFSVQHYRVLKEHLNEMSRLNIVEKVENRRQSLVIPTGKWVNVDAEAFYRAMNELKYKEFCLWLSLQLQPTSMISSEDIVERIHCANATQARNILNRLGETNWVKVDDSSKWVREVRYRRIITSKPFFVATGSDKNWTENKK